MLLALTLKIDRATKSWQFFTSFFCFCWKRHLIKLFFYLYENSVNCVFVNYHIIYDSNSMHMYSSSGCIDKIEIILHPSTGHDTSKQYVCMTLIFRPPEQVNCLSQNGHLWGFSPLCTLSCLLRPDIWVYVLSHLLQLNLRSPVWTTSWVFKSVLLKNFLSQWEQVNVFPPPTECIFLCLVKSLWYLYLLSQMEQWKGFSPVWVR